MARHLPSALAAVAGLTGVVYPLDDLGDVERVDAVEAHGSILGQRGRGVEMAVEDMAEDDGREQRIDFPYVE